MKVDGQLACCWFDDDELVDVVPVVVVVVAVVCLDLPALIEELAAPDGELTVILLSSPVLFSFIAALLSLSLSHCLSSTRVNQKSLSFCVPERETILVSSNCSCIEN